MKFNTIPKRSAGVMLPVSALGKIENVTRWLEFLAEAGQSYWQILPLNIPGEGGSPYKSVSAFALDPALGDRRTTSTFMRMLKNYGDSENSELRTYFDFVDGNVNLVAKQYAALFAWRNVAARAHSLGIEIIGDVPIYVAPGSSDVAAHPELFRTDAVAGVPPDAFTDDGQLWGNPLYDWQEHERTGFEWWLSRIAWQLQLCDVVRIDHFRGLDSYWAVPNGAESAKLGHWEPGPGRAFVDAIRSNLPDARIIAEDLGDLTDSVRELVEYSGFPGMKVLQFAFDASDGGSSLYLPENCGENSVVYTGTHDNDTTLGWSSSAPLKNVEYAKRCLGVLSDVELPSAFVRAALECGSKLAIIPIQDWLELGSDARINAPGTVSKRNWAWKLDLDALTPQLAKRMQAQTLECNR